MSIDSKSREAGTGWHRMVATEARSSVVQSAGDSITINRHEDGSFRLKGWSKEQRVWVMIQLDPDWNIQAMVRGPGTMGEVEQKLVEAL